jgi:hypothetical protein
VTPHSLKVFGLAWVVCLTLLLAILIVWQVGDPGNTVFSAADMVLVSMIVGAYFITDGRLRNLEENQARILEHLNVAEKKRT